MAARFEAYFDERPQPKGRPRFVKGRSITPTATREYEATLVYWMRQEAVRNAWVMPDTTDVDVHIKLFFEHSGKPPGDVDNYAKAITDAANGVLYRDDRQIRRLTVERVTTRTEEGFWLTVSEAVA